MDIQIGSTDGEDRRMVLNLRRGQMKFRYVKRQLPQFRFRFPSLLKQFKSARSYGHGNAHDDAFTHSGN